MNRRRFLLAAAGAGLAACSTSAPPAPAPVFAMPSRGEFLIRNAYIITMDAAGDIAGGDVHVKDGAIVAAGTGIQVAPEVEVLDGTGRIVLPGLIDTHWHMWNTMLRSMAGDTQEKGYFAMSPGIGKEFTPADMYQSVRLAAAEAINGGITFVHDWAHNMRSAQHADEDLRALREAGIRGRFSYGTSQGAPADELMNIADIARLRTGWDKFANEGLLSLGLAWRGGTSDVARKELDAARGMGIPVSAHAGVGPTASVGDMVKAKLLGKDMQLIHAVTVTQADIKAIAEAGCSVSLSPFTELRTGFGFPKTGEFLDAGVRVGLSVDTTGLSGNADMFSIMKLIQNLENARALSEFKFPARRALELATIEGARSMGVDNVVGSISPGKRADLIVVNTRALNLAVMGDPVGMIVEAASPANVETVVVDGRILKRNGRLTAVDQDLVIREAAAAFEGVRKRAGW